MRWWCGPHELCEGREFCEEFCSDACQAETVEACCWKPVDPIPENAYAWQVFRDSFWQFQSNGFGDGTLNALYVQQMLGDRGVTGPRRDGEMQKIRVMAETLAEMQRIRAKRKPEKP